MYLLSLGIAPAWLTASIRYIQAEKTPSHVRYVHGVIVISTQA